MAGIKKSKFIWMDGKFIKWNNAKVHILTHALHYGSAVFEGMHSYKTVGGTAVFRLDEHAKRLFYSANALGMKLKFAKAQLKNAIKKLIRINGLNDAYIRPLAYYGYGSLDVCPYNLPVSMAVISLPAQHYYPKGLNVMTSNYIRHSEKSTVFGAKISGNYANSILAMFEARKKGYDEALMLDEHGFVSEGPAENIFLVKNGNLVIPDSRSALPGVTRDSIIKISKDLGINVFWKKITLKEAKNADEAFFSGTLAGILPVISIDSKDIGNGKAGEITLMIRGKFYDIVRGKDKKYSKWLDYVDRK